MHPTLPNVTRCQHQATYQNVCFETTFSTCINKWCAPWHMCVLAQSPGRPSHRSATLQPQFRICLRIHSQPNSLVHPGPTPRIPASHMTPYAGKNRSLANSSRALENCPGANHAKHCAREYRQKPHATMTLNTQTAHRKMLVLCLQTLHLHMWRCPLDRCCSAWQEGSLDKLPICMGKRTLVYIRALE